MRDLAKIQLVLANERTFAAWIRTGLAFLAAGLAFEHFFQDDYGLSVPIVSTLLVLLSLTCFVFSTLHFWHLEMRVAAKECRGAPHAMLLIFSAAMVMLSLFAITMFWLMY